MTRYRIILNPISGRGNGAQAVPQLEKILSGYGLDYELIQTERPWHAVELAQQAAINGYDVAVAVGGDGTANEVLNGLMLAKQATGKTCTMGVLSVGRGNDFAFGMGIPTRLEAGCQTLRKDNRRKIDIGFVRGGDYPQGRYFGNGIGIGFDAVVGFVAAKMTRLSGFPSYIIAALKTIFLYYQAPLVQIEFNDQIFQTASLMISVMNGCRMGGGFMMAPQAQVNDGLLNLCIARQVSRARIFVLIPHFLRGTQSSQADIRTAQTRSITVRALQGSLPAHADGETLCTAGQQLQVELLPEEIELIYQPAEVNG
jgi:diacylglycerol kinase (ATP)